MARKNSNFLFIFLLHQLKKPFPHSFNKYSQKKKYEPNSHKENGIGESPVKCYTIFPGHINCKKYKAKIYKSGNSFHESRIYQCKDKQQGKKVLVEIIKEGKPCKEEKQYT